MPIEAIAITNSTATGMSVSCSGVSRSVNGTSTTGPNGITEKVTNAGITAITGARRKTTLSAAFGMMSSLSASFTPSASDWSRPKGPLTLGPMRCCIRATTRRSHQMLNSVSSTRTTKISTALMTISHHGSWPNAVEPVDRGRRGEGEQSRDVTGPLPSRSPWLPGEARSARTPRPTQLAGTQTTPSTMSADLGRQRDRAAVTGDGRPASGTRAASYVARGEPGDRPAGGGPQRVVAVLQRAVVEHLLPGGEPEAASARAARWPRAGAVRGRRGRRRARRPRGRAPPSAPRASATVRKPSGPWPSRQLLGDAGEDRAGRAARPGC